MEILPTNDSGTSYSVTQLEEKAFINALQLFHEAAEQVPAYKDFLNNAGIKHLDIQSKEAFLHVPLTDKVNYFSKYSLQELSWNGTLANAKYISKSSGSTGVPFFWPRGEAQDMVIGNLTQPIYEKIFSANQGTTLFVNSFSLGVWIAGMEFFNSSRWAAEHGTPITVITPGIDKEETVNQIKKLAPMYSRVILAGYPPFIKDILDHGSANGVEWATIHMNFLFGGEAVSEVWRDNILARAGIIEDSLTRSVNIYGMAESGIVAHETPTSILLRRCLIDGSVATPLLPDMAKVSGLYQYDPMVRYFERGVEDSIVITANAGLPLIRYNTCDNGGILPVTILDDPSLVIHAKESHVDLSQWQRPFIYLYGRKDFSISFYALIIYNENIKYALEHSQYGAQCSGLFIMSVDYAENMDQRFDITIELSQDIEPSEKTSRELAKDIAENISLVNSEYAKLYGSIGERALPNVTLLAYGQIETTPGRKHRWVKRS